MYKELPKRKQIRLDGFDYSSRGMYFVTICISGRHAMLWENDGIDQGKLASEREIRLSEYGIVVEKAIKEIPDKYANVFVNKFCIMPDHIHMILLLRPDMRGRMISAPTLSTIVGQMKRWVSRQVGFSIWQKSFYDRIIRDEEEYKQICKYIDENPIKIRIVGEHM